MSQLHASRRDVSRRGFLAGFGALGIASTLGACATSTPARPAGGGGQSSTALVLKSRESSDNGRKGMQALLDEFAKQHPQYKSTLNTMEAAAFQQQIRADLTLSTPPDVLTWFAGEIASDFAQQSLLLDVTSVYPAQGYSEQFAKLSTDATGKKIFIPTVYYWWGVFYRKSYFDKWGVAEPKTWDEFVALCKTLQGKGVSPIALPLADAAWLTASWFDYLNLRINGAGFHRALLAGNEAYTDARVTKVLDTWKEVLPYLDPASKGLASTEGYAKWQQGKDAMFLCGPFLADAMPADVKDDISFFQFPIVDPAVPVVEEAPLDGFIASAHTANPEGAKAFLGFVATPAAQELYLKISGNALLPANSDAKSPVSTPLLEKGRAMVAGAADVTQFFNRDTNDDQLNALTTALVRFIDEPDKGADIQKQWQSDSAKARGN
ncbi:carbohydrate ABC transporter substrate-binding protein [Nonomuraea terrae]|uniref:Carbohydrate ABC transporter substrate-binding protein n=1 Tax=Nonomuraea terrae TaxID=2530383 RepID=A0A4R4YGE6_9ACTN|nr:ABC transporter substrate-binding protein [Nonomuraea terrae]TDD42969.1 carbohydrate ABC transporter substrate-binding protein [Nonomuraea terrae]